LVQPETEGPGDAVLTHGRATDDALGDWAGLGDKSGEGVPPALGEPQLTSKAVRVTTMETRTK